MANNYIEGLKIWLVVDGDGKAYGLPNGVVFYSWSDAAIALQLAKDANQLPAKGLRAQPFVSPKVNRRHER